ncbi:transcriptional regulator LysR family [Photobacterium aphoticum]|nr:transcriptional regulator LysR family [Photobacterium aphoticum]
MKTVNTWRFYDDDKEITVPVKGNFQSDNGDVLLEVALSGLGLVLLPIWMVKPYLESGQLVQVLANYTGQDIPFNAIYPHSRYTPLKVRCFVDFLKEKLAQCEALTL